MSGGFYESGGTPIARAGSVARRISAFIAMVAIVLIVLAVMWRVYRHHKSTIPHDEPTIVELAYSIA